MERTIPWTLCDSAGSSFSHYRLGNTKAAETSGAHLDGFCAGPFGHNDPCAPDFDILSCNHTSRNRAKIDRQRRSSAAI